MTIVVDATCSVVDNSIRRESYVLCIRGTVARP